MPDDKKLEQFVCPSCSAEMEFDPQSGELKCRFCAHLEALPPPQCGQITAHALAEILAKTDGSHLQSFTGGSLQVSCSACGSVVVFEPPEVAGACPFCASPIVAQPVCADPLIAPDAVLPAKIPKDKATAEVQQWLATRWFAPNALQKLAQPEGIVGVYLPFWNYAANTESGYQGQRGQHYYETEQYQESDGQGGTVQRSRQVQRTMWYPASGQVSRAFQDVLIPATRSVAESKLNGLAPWDLESLCPYEPAYLAGFKAQRYQLELSDGFEEAKGVMKLQIERDVRTDIGGDDQIVNSISTDYSNETFLHLLLPVWIGAYRFQGKVYQVAVNARTGEVQGERPYSTGKITLLVIVILAVLCLIYMAKR